MKIIAPVCAGKLISSIYKAHDSMKFKQSNVNLSNKQFCLLCRLKDFLRLFIKKTEPAVIRAAFVCLHYALFYALHIKKKMLRCVLK